jgi:3-isopropylmalate/(R)-2-methylmalate dehydratase small subunit
MQPITTLTSKVVPLLVADIDTDQIIPARFLKVTDKAGLGKKLFHDWRYQADGTPKADFVLEQPEHQGSQVLLAGDNFGCGSSREHAPWALLDWGIRAVISTSFADIFRNNALKNGLLPVAIDADAHARLVRAVEKDPGAQVVIDLAAQTARLPDGSLASFEVDGFARKCLLAGNDQLGYLCGFADQIAAYERAREDNA